VSDEGVLGPRGLVWGVDSTWARWCALAPTSMHRPHTSTTIPPGSIPPALLAARNLSYLDLSNNNFTGALSVEGTLGLPSPSSQHPPSASHPNPTWIHPPIPPQHAGAIPPLPAGLELFNISANRLTALPRTLPPLLSTLDASHNLLEGAAPAIPAALVHLNLEDNRLSGGMPGFDLQQQQQEDQQREGQPGAGGSGAGRRLLQSPVAAGSSSSSPPTPALRSAYLARNALTSSLPAEWTTVPRRLEVLDLSNNRLGGELPASPWALSRLVILDVGVNALRGAPASLVWRLGCVCVLLCVLVLVAVCW